MRSACFDISVGAAAAMGLLEIVCSILWIGNLHTHACVCQLRGTNRNLQQHCGSQCGPASHFIARQETFQFNTYDQYSFCNRNGRCDCVAVRRDNRVVSRPALAVLLCGYDSVLRPLKKIGHA